LIGVMYLLKRYVEKSALQEQMFVKTDGLKKRTVKHSASFFESIKMMAQSRFLIAMVFNSLFYYIATNLIESSWKSSMKVSAEYNNENKRDKVLDNMAWEQIYVGLLVILVLFTPISRLTQAHGWLTAAIVPPLVTLVSSLVVFGSAFYNYPLAGKNEDNIIFPSLFRGCIPNFTLECYGGIVCVGSMKVAKYAFYDISKESISMLIDGSYRSIFKIIYDSLCGKIGKSMGSLYGVMWASRGYIDVRASAPVTLVLCIIASGVWIRALIYLNKKQKKAVQTSSTIDIDLFSGKKDFE